MFLKDIHRNIEGVITATQSTDEQVYQELDEYVVTKELQKHFNTFFDAYKKGIIGDTSKMGVWIQGFFGSGKSHFLKILAYILENKVINGKTAFDFFTEGDESVRKIKDDMTIANMKLAVDKPTNVILFNVESKHAAGVEEKSSLVNVFLKVFNNSIGYSTIPQLADLERSLSKAEKFAAFKSEFEAIEGKSWEESRNEVDFLEDEIVETLVKIDYFSEPAARNWFAKYDKDYQISIEDFAKLVSEYLQSKDNKHEQIVFLVDEIGQYIGGNSSLTLQLQTIVEELGTNCRGKAWVIVTSQQAIDKITDIAGTAALDFSKIKGRFETTLSLSSANADEVIQKRILAKNSVGQDYLEADYPNHESDIKSKFVFESSPELKIYSGAKNYVDVYPFVPYQFNLLANILTQISKHSIQGANLSRGERSLLAFFKETAERNADNESESLVSMDQFYPSLEKWLNETENAKVIKQAEENSRIVTDDSDQFNVNVLKVLFMIKYVDQNIKPTLNNITNLMIRSVNEDKLDLRKKVEKALNILVNENLIRKNIQSYIFQTDEEQEVTRLIGNMELNPTDVENKLAVQIFDEIVGKSSFNYQNINARSRKFESRYNFNYNLYVDDYAYRKNSNPQLEVKIVTPYYDEIWNDETQLMLKSTKNQMLINLPVDQEFMRYITTYLKVEKYIVTANASSAIKNFAAVKAEKITENQELGDSIQNQLDNFLKEATFYFNNSKLEVSGSDFKARLNSGLQQMAKLVYHKNDLVEAAISESDINSFLRENDTGIFKRTENQNVVDEVKRYLQLQKNKNLSTTMRALRDNFVNKEPYGFINEDIEWAIARLFKESSIVLYKNAIPLSTTDNISDISKVIFDRKTPEKIRVELRIKSNDTQKRMANEIGSALFESKNIVDDNNDDTTFLTYKNRTKDMIEKFSRFIAKPGEYYPQTDLINRALKVLQKIVDARDTTMFFEVLKDNKGELLDWAEDMESISNFHTSNQKNMWDRSIDYIKRIEESTLKESTVKLDEIISGMKNIMKRVEPYREIPRLGELNEEFQVEYLDFIEGKSEIALGKIQAIRQEILADLSRRNLDNIFESKVNEQFNKLADELEIYERLDQIELAPVRAESMQRNFTSDFTREENRIREEEAKKVAKEISQKPSNGSDEVNTSNGAYDVIPQKKVETIYITSLITSPNRIKNANDVDTFINELRQALLDQLNDDNEIDFRLN